MIIQKSGPAKERSRFTVSHSYTRLCVFGNFVPSHTSRTTNRTSTASRTDREMRRKAAAIRQQIRQIIMDAMEMASRIRARVILAAEHMADI